jgi:hypothetical protein
VAETSAEVEISVEAEIAAEGSERLIQHAAQFGTIAGRPV